jgi:hypothetical protein
MKRLPKPEGIEKSLTARQKERLVQLSIHSKRPLAIALCIVTSGFTRAEMDSCIWFPDELR